MSVAYVRLGDHPAEEEEPISEDEDLISLVKIRSDDPRDLTFMYTDRQQHGHQKFSVNLGMYFASDGNDNYNDTDNSPEGAYLMKVSKKYPKQ